MLQRLSETSYKTLPEIIKALDTKFGYMIWVGADYSQSNLVDDLKRIQKELDARTE